MFEQHIFLVVLLDLMGFSIVSLMLMLGTGIFDGFLGCLLGWNDRRSGAGPIPGNMVRTESVLGYSFPRRQ